MLSLSSFGKLAVFLAPCIVVVLVSYRKWVYIYVTKISIYICDNFDWASSDSILPMVAVTAAMRRSEFYHLRGGSAP